VIELTLPDAKTNRVVWSQQFEETEPVRAQTPEGLARALSIAMNRIVAKATPAIAARAGERVALRALRRVDVVLLLLRGRVPGDVDRARAGVAGIRLVALRRRHEDREQDATCDGDDLHDQNAPPMPA
jgi:hypothetical protein